MNSIKEQMIKMSKLLRVSFLKFTSIKYPRITAEFFSSKPNRWTDPVDQTPKPVDYNLPADYTYADTGFGGVFYKYYGDRNRN